MQKIILILTLFAQDKEFSKRFNVGINVSQSFYNSMWQGGDIGQITWNFYIDSEIKSIDSRKFYFLNTLRIFFGQTYTQNPETNKWGAPQKSNDKIEDEITVFYHSNLPFDFFFSNRFLSQFYDNSFLPVKRYINPIELTHTIGIFREFIKKEDKSFNIRLGFGTKENIDRIPDTLLLKIRETRVTVYGGSELLSVLKFKINKNLLYEARARFFKAFINSEAKKLKGTERENLWREIDFDIENLLTVSISKYIQISLYMQFLFDKEKINAVQVKENLSLGIVYKMF